MLVQFGNNWIQKIPLTAKLDEARPILAVLGIFFIQLFILNDKPSYYMEESVLLGTKPLVDSIRHFIRDPSGVFSVCHLCECRIVQ